MIFLFFGRMAALILATLAAIVLWVAYRMAEWRGFKNELSAPKSDAIVMLAIFLLTVLVDLTTGIAVGMVLAAFLFMKRMAEVTNVTLVSQELQDPRPSSDHTGAIYCRKVALERSGLLGEIGEENLFGNIDEALAAAEARVRG